MAPLSRAVNLKLRPRFALFFWFEPTVGPPFTTPHEVGNQVQRKFQLVFHGSIFQSNGGLVVAPARGPYINRHKMGSRFMPEVQKSHTAPPSWHFLNTETAVETLQIGVANFDGFETKRVLAIPNDIFRHLRKCSRRKPVAGVPTNSNELNSEDIKSQTTL